MHPIKSLLPVRLALFALLALPCSLALAEDKAETPTPARVDPYVISIDFPGGPLSKLVQLLNANKESKLSIIQSAGLDPILPAFSVNNAPIDSVMVALGRIVEAQGYRLAPTGPGIAVLTQIEKPKATSSTAYPLTNKLKAGLSVEDITSAIQTACEFASQDGKSSTLRFKYHPGTKLLFIAGTKSEIEIAQSLLANLPER